MTRADEKMRKVIKVPVKKYNNDDWNLKEIEKLNLICDSIDGNEYETNYRTSGKYIITKEYYVGKRKYNEVQFLNTGNITQLRQDSIKRGQHPVDFYERNLLGVGYLGDYLNVPNFTKEERDALKKVWTRMIYRCYDGTRKDYDDVYVSSEWHCFANFLKDVNSLPQYNLAKDKKFKGYQLDKDYYGSNCYNKDVCVFLSAKDNTIYRSSQVNAIEIRDKDKLYYVLSYTHLGEIFNVSKNTAKRWVMNGKSYDEKRDIRLTHIEPLAGYLYRYELK